MIPHVNENNDEFDEKNYAYDTEEFKKVKWTDWILLNRPLKVVIILLLFTVVAPVLLFHFLFHSTTSSDASCLIRRESRLPCGYGNVTAAECHRECCYDHTNGFCFHSYPSRFTYVLNQNWTEEVFLSPKTPTVPYGYQRSLENIRISVDEVTTTHLSLTFYKSEEQITGRKIQEKYYEYEIVGEDLNVVVNSTQGNIFNTEHGPFIAANDIWEITFRITNESMFGFGEIPLKEDSVKIIYNHKGGMSSVPLIFAKLNGSYHGLLFDTVGPTEVNIRNDNQLVVRSITNWGLKFHLFVGPEPSDIMRDVMNLTGAKKGFENWMLGAHICSEPTTLDELRAFITTANSQNMPFESHCGAAPAHFSRECNDTYVELVNDGATALRNARKKFVPHVSPYIQYTEELDIESTTAQVEFEVPRSNQSDYESCFDEELYEQYIIRDPGAEYFYKGVVDDQDVIYPKYDNVSEEFMKHLWVYTDVDGVILENSWPLDESEKSINKTHLYLPYFSENFETAFELTPQWNATLPERYLYTHNEYGNHFATAFEMITEGVPIRSTSQWMNGNMPVVRQGIETSWSSLQRELVEASLGGISGHWYWSSPVCGDTEDFDDSTHTRLCAKWYMASTYFPIVHIYSKDTRRDPFAFTGTHRAHMITALRTRMTLIPYFYSVLQEGPLLRPMFYQFPSTEELTNLTSQFSVGEDLLIVPNLEPGQSHVHVWMPPGQWFEFGSGYKVKGDVGEIVTMSTTEADFLTLIRGGSIIVRQTEISLTVADTKQRSPYTVLIALDCDTRNITEDDITTQASTEATTTELTTTEASTTIASGETTVTDAPTSTEPTTTAIPTITTCSAKGKFYMSPNMTILFEGDATTLKITAEGDGFDIFCDFLQATWASDIWFLRVYGLAEENNNNDHHFTQDVSINLCDLEINYELSHQFIREV